MSASALFAPLRHVVHQLRALLRPARRPEPAAGTSMRVNPFFDFFLDPPAADSSAR